MDRERFLGHRSIDGPADVYSLACVLFESLTAQRPFPVAGLPALMHAHTSFSPPLLTSLRPDLPAAVDEVVRRGMAKDPVDRYSTPGELAADASRAVHGMALGRTSPRPGVGHLLPAAPVGPQKRRAPTAVLRSSPPAAPGLRHPRQVRAPAAERQHRSPRGLWFPGAALVVAVALFGVFFGQAVFGSDDQAGGPRTGGEESTAAGTLAGEPRLRHRAARKLSTRWVSSAAATESYDGSVLSAK